MDTLSQPQEPLAGPSTSRCPLQAPTGLGAEGRPRWPPLAPWERGGQDAWAPGTCLGPAPPSCLAGTLAFPGQMCPWRGRAGSLGDRGASTARTRARTCPHGASIPPLGQGGAGGRVREAWTAWGQPAAQAPGRGPQPVQTGAQGCAHGLRGSLGSDRTSQGPSLLEGRRGVQPPLGPRGAAGPLASASPNFLLGGLRTGAPGQCTRGRARGRGSPDPRRADPTGAGRQAVPCAPETRRDADPDVCPRAGASSTTALGLQLWTGTGQGGAAFGAGERGRLQRDLACSQGRGRCWTRERGPSCRVSPGALVPA